MKVKDSSARKLYNTNILLAVTVTSHASPTSALSATRGEAGQLREERLVSQEKRDCSARDAFAKPTTADIRFKIVSSEQGPIIVIIVIAVVTLIASNHLNK